MTNVSSRSVIQTRHEAVIPNAEYKGWGATAADVSVAVALLANRYRDIYGKDPSSDDWYRVWAVDDAVVLFFTTEEVVE